MCQRTDQIGRMVRWRRQNCVSLPQVFRSSSENTHDIGAAEYNQRFRERELQYLQKKTAKLGYTLSLA
jgi:hypothetical protein